MKKIMLTLIAGLIATAVFAQSEHKTMQVNVFKNGTYFIVKKGSVAIKMAEATR